MIQHISIRKIMIFSFLIFSPCSSLIANTGSNSTLNSHIQKILNADNIPTNGLINNTAVKKFYASRKFAPAWIKDGAWTSYAKIALARMEYASEDGLKPTDYQISTDLTGLSTQELAAKDIDLTVNVMHCCIDMGEGRPELKQVDSTQFHYSKKIDPVKLLLAGLKSPNFGDWFSNLSPSSKQYVLLKQQLAHYRMLAKKPWPALPRVSLKRGSRHGSVRTLRYKLAVLGDLEGGNPESRKFSKKVEAAIKNFQWRHGLQVDGIVKAETRNALNTSLLHRINQIKVNMERLRWVPDHRTGRHILVNTAGFFLEAYNGSTPELAMRVIVGKEYGKTPMFSANMYNVKFNPTWTVPHTIARKAILPQILKDRNHLQKNHFKVYSGWGPKDVRLDPRRVNWRSLRGRKFPYKLVQASGDNNALGLIRFSILNPHGIYLHDTPQKSLFNKTVRAYSSGCVRVEDPVGLAEFVLKAEGNWDKSRIKSAMNGRDTNRIVTLSKRIPVQIAYYTSWVDTKGKTHFYRDVYSRDQAIINRLNLSQKRSS